MEVEFHTVDVFTGRAFAGNQVAVVPDAVNEHELAFCRHYGLEVVALDSFRCPTSEDIRAISSDQVAERVLGNAKAIADCDTIFISCTNLLTMDRIEAIEAHSGRPVVTSNQASLWAGRARMGVPMRDIRAGSLFRRAATSRAA